jgi:phage/plasmid-associated DNA primase
LFKAWERWCEDRGENAGSQTVFGERINGRDGIERKKSNGKVLYVNLALRDANEPNEPDGASDGDREGCSPATLPIRSDSEFTARSALREGREGYGDIRSDTHAPAPAGDADTHARPRARSENEESLGCADNRTNPPYSPYEAVSVDVTAANAMGRVAGESPPHDGARDDWEDP